MLESQLAKGKVTVRLPELAKGTYAIKVSLKPTSTTKKYVSSAEAMKITLRVK